MRKSYRRKTNFVAPFIFKFTEMAFGESEWKETLSFGSKNNLARDCVQGPVLSAFALRLLESTWSLNWSKSTVRRKLNRTVCVDFCAVLMLALFKMCFIRQKFM